VGTHAHAGARADVSCRSRCLRQNEVFPDPGPDPRIPSPAPSFTRQTHPLSPYKPPPFHPTNRASIATTYGRSTSPIATGPSSSESVRSSRSGDLSSRPVGEHRRDGPGADRPSRMPRSTSCWTRTAGDSACVRALRRPARSTRPPSAPCGSSTRLTRSDGSPRSPRSTGWSSRRSRATDLPGGSTSSRGSARTGCFGPRGETEKSGSSTIQRPLRPGFLSTTTSGATSAIARSTRKRHP
jgi:hypothetical protein